ncbi:MAG: hypothetical protein H6806_03125 [Planctomycetes bacterium]|nr:hypothetical protein [Planctomycetota bacterium]MCB9901110.1 hypothetical protein [Planctomycetota bacterium]
MSRRTALVPLVLVLLLLAAPAARAERVPLVPPERLPVVGTCAPIAEGNVTHVLTSPPETPGWWFRVAGMPEEVDENRLGEVLAARVGPLAAGARTEHAVWITCAADHKWAHVVKVLIACDRAGIYRVGVRVRSDSAAGVFGFPLFLPPPHDAVATPQGKAVGLEVRLQTVLDRSKMPDQPPDAPADDPGGVKRSNPVLVYTAARRAVERHGAVVATARLAANANVQDALSILDGLYRAGCAGVRMPQRALAGDPALPVFPLVWVNGIALGDGAPPAPLPPVAPRAEPWGLYGANRPGWLDLDIVEESQVVRDASLKSWIAQGRMPAFERERSGAALAEWGEDMGAVLGEAMRGQAQRLAAYLASAASVPEASAELRARLAREGGGLDAVRPSNVAVTLELLQGGTAVGRVAALVQLGSTRSSVVWMRWMGPGGVEGAVTASRGVASALRLFLEGELLACRSGGAAAMTWAQPDDVVSGYPLVARESVQRTMAGREASAQQLQQALEHVAFDAVRVLPGQASAALLQAGRVVGVGYLLLAAEDDGLLLRDVQVRRAE